MTTVQLILGFLGLVVTTVAGYLIAKRATSGSAATTDAATLFSEVRLVQKEAVERARLLQGEVEVVRARVIALETELAAERAKVSALEAELAAVRAKRSALEAELAAEKLRP